MPGRSSISAGSSALVGNPSINRAGSSISSGSYWTPQTKAFLNASGIKNDSTVYFAATAYAQTGHDLWVAVNNFTKELISDGVWNKIIALYPFIGEAYAQAKFNLVNPLDTDSAHRLEEGGIPAYSGIGVIFNGINNYLRTNVIPSAQGAYNNFSIGSYILSAGTKGRQLYGVEQGADKRLELMTNWDGTHCLSDIPGFSNRLSPVIPNEGIGLWQFWAESGNLYWTVDNVSQIGKTPIAAVTMPDIEIYLGASNINGSPQQWDDVDLSAWYYGIDFTAEDNLNIAERLNTLMIDLKRIAV